MRGGWGESGNKINGLHLGKEWGGEKHREGGGGEVAGRVESRFSQPPMKLIR